MLRRVSKQVAIETAGAAVSREVHSVRPGEVVKWPAGSFMELLEQAEFAPLFASAASFPLTRPVLVKPMAPLGTLEWRGLATPPKRPAWPFLAGAGLNFAAVATNIGLFAAGLTAPWTGALVALNMLVGCGLWAIWEGR